MLKSTNLIEIKKLEIFDELSMKLKNSKYFLTKILILKSIIIFLKSTLIFFNMKYLRFIFYQDFN